MAMCFPGLIIPLTVTDTETPTSSNYPIPNKAKIITAETPFLKQAPLCPFQVKFTNVELFAEDDEDVLVVDDTEVIVPVFNTCGYSIHADSILDTIRARLPRRMHNVSLDRVPAELLAWASTFWVEVKQDQNRLVILCPMKCTDVLPTWTPNERPTGV